MFKFVTIVFTIFASSVLFGQQVLGPFAGAVTENSVTFIISSPTAVPVKIEYSEDQDFGNSMTTAEQMPQEGSGYTKHLAGGLKSDTRYYYRALISGKPADKIHTFKTFPAEKNYTFSFGFGSCMLSGYAAYDPYIFKTIAADTSLRFFVQLGDWSYPDFTYGRGYNKDWNLLVKTYNTRYSYDYDFPKYVLSIMPVVYVYDDHDFAGNNSNGTEAGKENSFKAYQTMFPHYRVENPSNGIWQSFRFADAEFFVIDSRSQRSPNASAFNSEGIFDPPEGHSMLAGFDISGTNQMDWLINGLNNSTAKWKVIVSPVMFNPQYAVFLKNSLIRTQPQLINDIMDKWAGFPGDIEKVTGAIEQNNIKNVIVISGDSHSSFIDDGTNSVIPEIGSSNLDVTNTKLNLKAAIFGYTIFNRGGYDGDGRAYGRVTFSTDAAMMEIIDEKGIISASYNLPAR